MLPDLDRVIRLQQIEDATTAARQTIDEYPARVEALQTRIDEAHARVEDAKARLAEGQAARRADEKELSEIQTRLARYKDQLLSVKTNREYTAMQHEIAAAQGEVDAREERILRRMLEADELTGSVRQAERDLAAAKTEVDEERQALDADKARLEEELVRTGEAREELVAEIGSAVMSTYETVARGRKGVGVAEARGGLCTVCHVRLRPQVFNDVRHNAAIIQCEHCQRILYFLETTPTAEDAPAAPPADAAPSQPEAGTESAS